MDAKKNAHRLGRIFRKAPTAKSKKLSTRDWSQDIATTTSAATSAVIEASFGVSMSALKKIVEGLNEAERLKAALGEDPTPLEEEAIQRRMAKFGTTATAQATESGVAVDAETLAKRMHRFGTASPQGGADAPLCAEGLSDAMKKRMERFGGSGAPAQEKKAITTETLTLTEEQREAMERRAKRFAA